MSEQQGTYTAEDIRSEFVPNSFQTPNAYVDTYLSLLTCEEYVVLSYATRRILGFQKRQDHISLSQFTDGTKSKDGKQLDFGTGLSLATVKKCLDSLCDIGLLVKVADNDSKTNHGILWGLQLDSKKVKMSKLLERQSQKGEKQKKKMSKARSMRKTPANGIEGVGANGIEHPPANGIETQNTEEIQGNPVVKEILDIYKGYFGKFLSENDADRWVILYEAVGKARAREIAAWAFKKQIHLVNRSGLIDSMETAAKNWHNNNGKGKPNGNSQPSPEQEYTPADYELAAQIRAARGLS